MLLLLFLTSKHLKSKTIMILFFLDVMEFLINFQIENASTALGFQSITIKQPIVINNAVRLLIWS